MKIVTGHTGEAHVTAVDDAMFNISVFGGGNWVLRTGDRLNYEIESNNKINIKSGDVMMQGRHGRIEKNKVDICTIENGSQAKKRHDIIAVRYEKDSSGIEEMSTVVIKGAPGEKGLDPVLKTGDINAGADICEMPLYRVVLNGLNIEKVERMTEVLPSLHKHAFNPPVNNTASTSEELALSAAMGKNLMDKVNTMMPKSGGIFTGGITVNNGDIKANRHVRVATSQKVIWDTGANVMSNGKQHLYFMGSDDGNYTTHLGVHDGMWTFDPDVSGNLQLGAPNHKWGSLYAKNGAIQTSDRNVKKNIHEIDDKYIDFFMRLKPVTFKFKDGKRTHVGFVSQDVEEAMKAVGLTDLDFAGFCKDAKTKRVEKSAKVKVMNEDGKETVETIVYFEDEIIPDEYIYSLRYDEFIALNTMMIQKLSDRVTALENAAQKG